MRTAAQPVERALPARRSARSPPSRACQDETSAIGLRDRKPAVQTASPGIALDAGIENFAKRLQILKEAIPPTSTAAFLGMRAGWSSSGQVLRDAAAQMGISLIFTFPEGGKSSDIEHAFATLEQQRPDAVLVSGEGDL